MTSNVVLTLELGGGERMEENKEETRGGEKEIAVEAQKERATLEYRDRNVVIWMIQNELA